jgi:hypothetical protein
MCFYALDEFRSRFVVQPRMLHQLQIWIRHPARDPPKAPDGSGKLGFSSSAGWKWSSGAGGSPFSQAPNGSMLVAAAKEASTPLMNKQ